MKVRGQMVELFYQDLLPAAKKQYLEAMDVETPDQLNADVFPIAVIMIPDVDRTPAARS